MRAIDRRFFRPGRRCEFPTAQSQNGAEALAVHTLARVASDSGKWIAAAIARDFQYDVFLSHNSADKPRVRRWAERLRAVGLRRTSLGFRISSFEFPPKAARVGLERSTVLFRDPANASRRFIPLLLADCRLPDALRHF